MKIILKRSQPPTPAATAANGNSASAFPTSATPIIASDTISAATPATPSVTMTQKGRVSKPTAKKRARELDDSEDESRPPLGGAGNRRVAINSGAGPPKRPKLILKKSAKSKTASIVLKQNAKEAPPRSKGEGYDSEDDDREPDPLIEEEFVLRMPPGDDCDYLRRMVEERKIGVPVKEGGADFQLKWLAGVERRALVSVRGHHYVGVLVDLPTITEGMKTWDKRNFMKSADICQMLLVFAAVADEVAAKSQPLPAMVAKDYRWPHGLTPPMHDCIHRRFRKRLSKKEIKDKEAELQRLLNEDRIAVETKWELFDDGRQQTETEGEGEGDVTMEDADGDEDEDAYGEVDEDYFGRHEAGGDADAEGEIDEAELMAEFMEEDEDEDGDEQKADDKGDTAGQAVSVAGAGASRTLAVATAAAAATGAGAASAPPPTADGQTPAGDASDAEDEDEDDEDDDNDLDEDEQARAEQAKGVREDIDDLKKNLQTLDAQLAATTNALLRKRIEGTRKRVLSELRLKQASIGEIDEEE